MLYEAILSRNGVTDGTLPTGTGYDKSAPIAGIFGIVTLLHGEYLILITDKKRTGKVLQADIYEATDFAVYPIDATPNGTAAYIASKGIDETYLLERVKSHLNSGPFYFSYGEGGYDLTSRLQVQPATAASTPLWERADDRFFWNKFVHSRMMDLTTRNLQDVSVFAITTC